MITKTEYTESREIKGFLRRLRLQYGVLIGLNRLRRPNSWPPWSMVLQGGSVTRSEEDNKCIMVSNLGQDVTMIFTNEEQASVWFKDLMASKQWSIEMFYDLGIEYESSREFNVSLAAKNGTDEMYVVKSINADALPNKHHIMQNTELNIMLKTRNGSLMAATDVLASRDCLHIVRQLMKGGSLLLHGMQNGPFSEEDTRIVMRSVFSGLQYIHMHGMVHCDIKPENLLLPDSDSMMVRIADFGATERLESDELVKKGKEIHGDRHYLAPEVVQDERFGQPIDMWACGIMMYWMLSGEFPFVADGDVSLDQAIIEAKLDFKGHEWDNTCIYAMHLMKGLLDPNPKSRLSVQEALRKRWMKKGNLELIEVPSPFTVDSTIS